MCEISSGEELTLDFPSNLFKRNHGFSIDFGGSGIKTVYTTTEGDHIRFHFTIHPRERKEEAFTVLKEKIAGRLDPAHIMYLTGYGCAENFRLLKNDLHDNVELVWELNYFVQSLRFLFENQDPEKIFFAPSEEAIKIAEARRQNRAKMMAIATNAGKEQTTETGDMVPPLPDKANAYPLLLALVGSAGGAVLVNADGTFERLGGIYSCGRTLLGLGSLLTGAKDFDELMTLAHQGNRENVDYYTKDVEFKEETIYSKFFEFVNEQRPVFLFGKTVGKSIEDFRREDLAASIVGNVAHTHAVYFHKIAIAANCPRMFVVGSLSANSRLYRQEVETDFRIEAETRNPGEMRPDIRFVRLGGFLGCMGALLQSLQKD